MVYTSVKDYTQVYIYRLHNHSDVPWMYTTIHKAFLIQLIRVVNGSSGNLVAVLSRQDGRSAESRNISPIPTIKVYTICYQIYSDTIIEVVYTI